MYPYLDDCLIVAKTKDQLQQSIALSIQTLQELGFLINYRKLCLQMTQRLTFLANISNGCLDTVMDEHASVRVSSDSAVGQGFDQDSSRQ